MAACTEKCILGKSGLNSGKSAQDTERPAQPPIKCPECGSSRIWKDGFRYVPSETGTIAVQRYICRKCGRRFSEDTAKNMPAPRGRVGSNPTRRDDVDLSGSYLEPNSCGYNRSGRKITLSSAGYTGTEARQDGPTPTCSQHLPDRCGVRKVMRAAKGQVCTLRQKSRIVKRAAGATKPTAEEIRGKIVEHLWWLKKQGYKKSTIELRGRLLRTLMKRGANLLVPDTVKETIARMDGCIDDTKAQYVIAYDTFAYMAGITWNPPHYEQTQKLPFIPTEAEIDQLIAACQIKTATLLQTLKETAMRIGEAWQLKWIDIDFERHVMRLNLPEKKSRARIFHISNKLIGMLKQLPKRSEKVFGYQNLQSKKRNFLTTRKRVTAHLQNPRILQITFHTFRHWKASVLYHQTKDILFVKEFLGHKRIDSTLRYIQLEKALFNAGNDEFHVKVAKTLDEACKLLETGFEYVTDMDTSKIFRKRK